MEVQECIASAPAAAAVAVADTGELDDERRGLEPGLFPESSNPSQSRYHGDPTYCNNIRFIIPRTTRGQNRLLLSIMYHYWATNCSHLITPVHLNMHLTIFHSIFMPPFPALIFETLSHVLFSFLNELLDHSTETFLTVTWTLLHCTHLKSEFTEVNSSACHVAASQ